MLFSLRITVFVFPGAAINIASRTGYEPAPRCFFPLCAELENKRVGGLRHISTTLRARQEPTAWLVAPTRFYMRCSLVHQEACL